MASRFVVSAKLGNWMHECLDRHGRQSAMGQLMAVELAIQETPGHQKMTQEAFDVLCGICGFWSMVQEYVLPLLGLGDDGIAALRADFCDRGRNGSLRSAFGDIMLKEPLAFDSFQGMGEWLKKNVPGIKAACDAKMEEATQAARESPAAILQELEKVEISVGIYLGQVTLDANAYREAIRKLSASNVDADELYTKEKKRHIEDVRAAQNHYQMSEMVFASESDMAVASSTKSQRCAGGWVAGFVASANANQKKLAKLLRVNASDIAV
eukprot:9197285-Lingulodinium_polyedra.AAC.1